MKDYGSDRTRADSRYVRMTWAYGNGTTRASRPSAYQLAQRGACQVCGSTHGNGSEHSACQTATCLYCETPQCIVNGLGHGACSVCYIGLLNEWTRDGTTCQRAHCSQPAVAIHRKRYHCFTHMNASNPAALATAWQERAKHWRLLNPDGSPVAVEQVTA